MYFNFPFKTSFGHLQEILPRGLACLKKTSLGHLIDIFLPTVPSQQTICYSKLATEIQKQGVKTIQVQK